jgi:hypothetical protein
MTRGPFTPPIVLYVIRGLTEPIRGSPSAEGIATAEDSGLESAVSPVREYAVELSETQFR